MRIRFIYNTDLGIDKISHQKIAPKGGGLWEQL